MPGLVPGIHVLLQFKKKDVDGRDEPGHDEQLRAADRLYFSSGASTAAAGCTSSCWASGSKNSPAAASASAAASWSSWRVEMSSPRLMRSASSALRATMTLMVASTSG